jgi:uncharacterized membrane protein (UPF0127 family)
MIQLICREKEIVLGDSVQVANSFITRLKGLMFNKEMCGFDGLLIKSCNSIHTFFMKYSIDVVFLDREYRVMRIIRGLRPWRLSPIVFKANQVLELKNGSLSDKIEKFDQLEVVCLK